MKKLWILFLIFPVLYFSTNNCSDPNDETESDSTAVLSGYVLNSVTLNPVPAAVVRIMEYTGSYDYTDSTGFFSVNVELSAGEQLNLITTPVNYVPDTLSVYVTPGENITGLMLHPDPTTEPVIPSGYAASIILVSVDPTNIGVRESGATDVAAITFIVRDSTGKPVDSDHSVDVNFSLGGSPGGGLFLSPSTKQTDNTGQVTTYLFSGDSAGVVQVVAQVDQPGLVIQSKPIAVSIYGGFPHIDHFAIGTEVKNIPGTYTYGVETQVRVFLGDKYGNPVKPETIVYFTTTAGIIEGSASTNEIGYTEAKLISAEPNDPIDPVLGPGFARISGRTIDQDQNTIEKNTYLLFSGEAQIWLKDSTFILENDTSGTINFKVCDHNGNPLSKSQSISVQIDWGDVNLIGNTSWVMGDVIDTSRTNFSFNFEDSMPDSIAQNKVKFRITTIGNNGEAEATIEGVAF